MENMIPCIVALLLSTAQASTTGVSGTVPPTTTVATTTATGTVPPTTVACKSKPADVVFLLDTSSSEGPGNFQKQLNFVKNFAKELTIGPKNIQIGIVTFSHFAQNEVWLNTYNSKSTLLEGIEKVRFRGGGTDTGAGLSFVKDHAFTTQHGHRANAVKIVIVVTDGHSTDIKGTSDQAGELHRSGAEIVAVGIGNLINSHELTTIASQPTFVLKVASFDALHTIENALLRTTCTIATSVCKVKQFDIVFLLDSSSSEGATNFQKQLDFVSKFTDYFDIGQKGVQIGLVTFSNDVMNQFFLNAYTTKADLKTAINRVKYVGGSTNTPAGLAYIRTTQFSAPNGARTGVDKVVIVMTDGYSQDETRTILQAGLLHKTAKVISIGIGSDLQQSDLDNIASDPQHVFRVGDFNALHTIEQELAIKTCTTTYRTTIISPVG